MHHDNDDEFWKHQYDQYPPYGGNLYGSNFAIVLLIILIAVISLLYYLV